MNITTILQNPERLSVINEALLKVVQEIVAGNINDATARRDLKNAIVAAGYHPELVSISINNVRAFLRIIQNDRREPKIEILYPTDEKEFTAPWENRTSLLNFTMEQAVQEQQIKRFDADEILKLLKAEKEDLGQAKD